MKKILVVGRKYFNFPNNITRALEKAGFEVFEYVFTDSLLRRNYLSKKLGKLGLAKNREAYERDIYDNWNEDLSKIVDEFQPDYVFAVNGEYLTVKTAEKIQSTSKFVLMTIDSINRKGYESVKQVLPFTDFRFFWDKKDVEYYRNISGMDSFHYYFGFDSNYYFPEFQVRDIDISFVGGPTPKRLKLLKKVAEFAHENNLRFVVGGHGYWGTSHFWKKLLRKKKLGVLADYCTNRMMTSAETADIIRRSKICLNIHVSDHEIVNSRFFEIQATNSFMLCDNVEHIRELYQQNKGFVMYADEDELIVKITEYLQDEIKRKTIANVGYEYVEKHFSVDATVEYILQICTGK